MQDALGRPGRILLLGGTSEIGLAILAALGERAGPGSLNGTEVILAGRDEQRLAEAGARLPFRVATASFDAAAPDTHAALMDKIFAAGDVDLVISAAGVLIPQPDLDADPARAGELVQVNFTGHVTALLAAARHMRAQCHGTIVVLSSVAAIRPRRFNFTYGAAKAGLDAFARGLADSLHRTGVRVLLVRPGFVAGKMTEGMEPAPLASTPDAVGRAVADRLARGSGTVWVPPALAVLAAAFRLVPRPLWRRLRR
jgi:decaprenylphospho-beta-D-erythro-pentofuranosid-2-ulose 2-reductase